MPVFMSALIGIPLYYASIPPLGQESQIYSLVSNFNIAETVLCSIDAEIVNTCHTLSMHLGDYLDWILAESEVCRCHSII